MTFPFCYVNKIIRDDQNLGKTIDLKTTSEQWFQSVRNDKRKHGGRKINKLISKEIIHLMLDTYMMKIVVKYQITSSLKKRLWRCEKPEKINVDKSKYL